MWIVAFITTAVLLVLALAAAAWCLIQWRTLTGEASRLQGIAERDVAALQHGREQLQQARAEVETLQRAKAELDAQHRSSWRRRSANRWISRRR